MRSRGRCLKTHAIQRRQKADEQIGFVKSDRTGLRFKILGIGSFVIGHKITSYGAVPDANSDTGRPVQAYFSDEANEFNRRRAEEQQNY